MCLFDNVLALLREIKVNHDIFQVLLASKVEISMSEELSELVSREREWR